MENPIKIKCKPTYNFQSMEFEWELTDENREEMFNLYTDLLEFLEGIAPEQEVKPAKKVKLATDKQLDLLDQLGVDYDDDVTQEEASNLIDKYFGKAKKKGRK